MCSSDLAIDDRITVRGQQPAEPAGNVAIDGFALVTRRAVDAHGFTFVHEAILDMASARREPRSERSAAAVAEQRRAILRPARMGHLSVVQ